MSKTELNTMLVHLTTDGVPKLHCPICKKAIFSLNGYVNHLRKHEPPGGFECRYCDASFCMEVDLKQHRNVSHTVIACRICKNIAFNNEDDYREHIKTLHNGVDREILKCSKCGAEYKSLEPYRRHMETKCGTIKPHKCDQCNMTFITKYNLKSHKEIHSGHVKYCCSFCGKKFFQRSRLIEHERTHNGEKPYKCDVCGKCFAHRESIVTHSSIHTGKRLVECKNCQARFSCHSNLIKHRRARPDTCGRPEFNPPKQRLRNYSSRIPAIVNPTSEIKIGISNKVIKPDINKIPKKSNRSSDEPNEQILRNIKKRGRPNKASALFDDIDNKKTLGPKKRIIEKLNVQGALNNENFIINITVENKDEYEDETNNDHVNSSNNVNYDNEFQLQQIEKSLENDNTEDGLFHNYKQYSNTNEIPIKEEHVEIELRDEKDVAHAGENKTEDFLDHKGFEIRKIKPIKFMNIEGTSGYTDDGVDMENNRIAEKLSNINENGVIAQSLTKKESFSVLYETEIILVNGANMESFSMETEDTEPIQEFFSEPTNRSDCRIMLNDITKYYPESKDNSSVKVDKKSIIKMLVDVKNSNFSTLNTAASDIDDQKAINIAHKADPISTNRKNDSSVVKEKPNDSNYKIKKKNRLSQRELKNHLNIIGRSKVYNCPHCVRIYHMRKPFEKHLEVTHKLTANQIQDFFNKQRSLETLKDDVFKCPVCDKIYLIEKRLEDHLQRHGAKLNLIHKCPCHCKLYFATKNEAMEHARKEHRDKIYCEICDKYWFGVDSLKNHIRNYHTKKQPRNTIRNLVCDKCGKKFPGRTSLSDHVRSDCGRKPLYHCQICGKYLTTAGILKTHLLLHSDESPFQCEVCGKRFKIQSQYKNHIRTRHSDEKPFKCHLCSKAYPYRESLLTHMTVHTGIKRFLCNGCGKRFTCISNLQAHRKVHADSCGTLPLNAKATQYMGVQKGYLLLGSKPEAGLDYSETNTFLAKEVLDHDLPITQELNFPSEPSAPLATVPLSFKETDKPPIEESIEIVATTTTLPEILSQFIETDEDNQNIVIL